MLWLEMVKINDKFAMDGIMSLNSDWTHRLIGYEFDSETASTYAKG